MNASRNFGDPAAEYAAARNGAILVERSDRRVLRAHGRDPVKMLQGLITNDIAGANTDRVVYAAVLTPKGRMIADLNLLRRGADVLMEMDAGAVDGLTAHLKKFVPPLFARFEDVTADWPRLGVYGPDAARLLTQVYGVDAASLLEDAAFTVEREDGDVVIVATSHYDVPGFELWLQSALASQHARTALLDAGVREAGHSTLDVLRIERGSPAWGAELTDTTIPLEAGLRTRAISETKGCYTGQEVIIRILHRGHVNWTLRGVLLGDVPTPARDTALLNADGKKVGRVTSAAWSPEHAQVIALAYVRREVEPPAALTVEGGGDARVVTLPFEDAGVA